MTGRDRCRRFYADREVLALFDDEPELVAIVDAIAHTAPELAPARLGRGWVRPVPLVATVAAGVVALLLVWPWRGDGIGVVERGAAALSGGPVVHARVIRQTRDDVTVDIQTGRETPGTIEVETWYDESRGRLRTQTVRNGSVVANHVAEAGDQGVARAVPDPAVAVFATRYRNALRSGRAEVLEDGAIPRLRVRTTAAVTQIVTLDARTLRPVAFRTGSGAGSVRWTVSEIDARPRAERDFATSPLPGIQRGFVARTEPGTVRELAEASSIWLGATFGRFSLDAIHNDVLVSLDASGRRSRGSGYRLVYRAFDGKTLQLRLSRQPEAAYGFADGRLTLSFAPIPPEGKLQLMRPSQARGPWTAQFRRVGWFVTVRAARKALALDAARQLRRVPLA